MTNSEDVFRDELERWAVSCPNGFTEGDLIDEAVRLHTKDTQAKDQRIAELQQALAVKNAAAEVDKDEVIAHLEQEHAKALRESSALRGDVNTLEKLLDFARTDRDTARAECVALREKLAALEVPNPCPECGGRGTKVYADTSTWRKRGGGQTLRSDVCDVCWGSRTTDWSGANLRKVDARLATLESELSSSRAEVERLGHEVSNLTFACRDLKEDNESAVVAMNTARREAADAESEAARLKERMRCVELNARAVARAADSEKAEARLWRDRCKSAEKALADIRVQFGPEIDAHERKYGAGQPEGEKA